MGRKGNSRFPAAKIKKIIQENQEIGKLCNSIPPIVQRSLEIFLDDIMDRLGKIAETYSLSKLTLSALKTAVEESNYDFMKDVLQEIEDLQKNKKKSKRAESQNKKAKEVEESD